MTDANDYQLAEELQKMEQVGAGTAREITKIVDQETAEADAQAHRVERSSYGINQKGLRVDSVSCYCWFSMTVNFLNEADFP